MGKNSKKVNKKKNQQIVKAENKQLMALKEKLTSQIGTMSYATALDTLAELIDKKCYEPEVIYQGAQLYFLMGDYERAASWVNNTLHYAPQHLEARLLLAKICLLEDRTDDAMLLYTFILEHYSSVLTAKQQEDIKEGADYTWRTDRDWLSENYPLVAALWSEKKETNFDEVQDTRRATENTDSVKEIIRQVLAKDLSLAGKIKLLNSFAGGYFVNRDFQSAQILLEKALSLDEYYACTLKNLAVLSKLQGDTEKALTYVAKIPQTDFILLKDLME